MPNLLKAIPRAIKKIANSGVRNGPPPSVRNMLDKYGDWNILNIHVCRSPLNSILRTLGNALTLGELDKKLNEMGYDNIFHLYMVLTISNGSQTKQLRFEKNQVVNLSESVGGQPHDFISIKLDNPITLNQFVQNGINVQRDSYWTYNVRTNNCQHFVNTNLRANGLLTPEIEKFVNQNATVLISGMLGDVATVVTDAAASVDTLQNGQGMKKKIISV